MVEKSESLRGRVIRTCCDYYELLLFFPVDCFWGSWSTWGSCSKTCGSGTYTRYRRKTKTESINGHCFVFWFFTKRKVCLFTFFLMIHYLVSQTFRHWTGNGFHEFSILRIREINKTVLMKYTRTNTYHGWNFGTENSRNHVMGIKNRLSNKKG